MGALMRATRNEIEDLVRGDADWWVGLCGRIAEEGQKAVSEECRLRGWSWGAFRGWVMGDVERYREYEGALQACVDGMSWATVGIADGASPEDVAVAKLRIETRNKLAGKVDRSRWGEKVEVEHRGVPILVIEVAGQAVLPEMRGEVVDAAILPAVEVESEEGFI